MPAARPLTQRSAEPSLRSAAGRLTSANSRLHHVSPRSRKRTGAYSRRPAPPHRRSHRDGPQRSAGPVPEHHLHQPQLQLLSLPARRALRRRRRPPPLRPRGQAAQQAQPPTPTHGGGTAGTGRLGTRRTSGSRVPCGQRPVGGRGRGLRLPAGTAPRRREAAVRLRGCGLQLPAGTAVCGRREGRVGRFLSRLRG